MSSEAGLGAPAEEEAWNIVPVGDRCLIVEFRRRPNLDAGGTVRAFAQLLLDEPIVGVVDVVPAIDTVAISYRPELFAADGIPFESARRRVASLLSQGLRDRVEHQRSVDIPVCYDAEFGPDLEEVALRCGLSAAQVVERHVASPHVVLMLGFAPGFPYIGGLDASLNLPRRSTPRTRVAAGSVAIAADQTSIYSLETPGGWNVIGRTPLKLFDAGAETPCLLRAGDRVRFQPVARDAYDRLAGESS